MYEKTERYSVEAIPGRGFEIRGVWQDDVHDIHTRILVDIKSSEIAEAEAQGSSVPFAICHEGMKCIKSIEGIKIGPGLTKAVYQELTGEKGCIHLAELVVNSVKALIQAVSREIPDWMDDDAYINKFFEMEKLYRNKCVYFSQPKAYTANS
ncbi:MAG TPA: DUF2889 domain-containing protein, partial [Syntrophomonadaceae bacterium]|nr:DUF2889 domain-containing protein [Syntrophomonadaceae bacterium]